MCKMIFSLSVGNGRKCAIPPRMDGACTRLSAVPLLYLSIIIWDIETGISFPYLCSNHWKNWMFLCRKGRKYFSNSHNACSFFHFLFSQPGHGSFIYTLGWHSPSKRLVLKGIFTRMLIPKGIIPLFPPRHVRIFYGPPPILYAEVA